VGLVLSADTRFRSRRLAKVAPLWLLAALFVATPAIPQSEPNTQKLITIRSVRAVAENGGAAVEIISNGPLVPAISKLDNPSRLVIDLPNARLSSDKKSVDFRSDQINGIRMNQFQQSPPLARIVVDLAKPVTYTWDAAGNRLMVRMHLAQETAVSVPDLPGNTQSGVVATRSGSASGVVLAGNRVPAGSSVTAGLDTAVLHLSRGGEVRVCPGTTVSITSSQNGRALMLGLSTGALETHYTLDASSDSIVTPDFRIQLTGPGEFHYGITADQHGNTCIQALPGNTSPLTVSELMGDGTYRMQPTQEVAFHGGHLSAVDSTVPGTCGCPPALPPLVRASAKSMADGALSEQPAAGAAPSAQPNSEPSLPVPAVMREPETSALPPSMPNDVHVQVEAPFVFNARNPQLAPSISMVEVKLLPVRDVPSSAYLQTEVAAPPHRRGFFGKIKGFFASIFG